MEVNFDNLRLMLQDSYNDLVSTIQQHYSADTGEIFIATDDVGRLEAKLMNLHNYIATVMCVYGGGTINDISNKIELKLPRIADEE